MAQARFRVRLELNVKEGAAFTCSGQTVAASASGFDKAVFEIASNPGDPFTPIHKTASGGEISRLMLAIKSVLAEADKIPSLVFDEIDAGISGKTAQAAGAKLAGLSRFHQILCVTHLPQIASFADNHYKAAKYTEDNRTFADIRLLDSKQREVEIANLLGGKDISQQAVENARLLIQEAQKL
jgi:DNA repair protein RecN (Recombination protein N)